MYYVIIETIKRMAYGTMVLSFASKKVHCGEGRKRREKMDQQDLDIIIAADPW